MKGRFNKCRETDGICSATFHSSDEVRINTPVKPLLFFRVGWLTYYVMLYER